MKTEPSYTFQLSLLIREVFKMAHRHSQLKRYHNKSHIVKPYHKLSFHLISLYHTNQHCHKKRP